MLPSEDSSVVKMEWITGYYIPFKKSSTIWKSFQKCSVWCYDSWGGITWSRLDFHHDYMYVWKAQIIVLPRKHILIFLEIIKNSSIVKIFRTANIAIGYSKYKYKCA